MKSLKRILCFILFLTISLVNYSNAAEQSFELTLVMPRDLYHRPKLIYLAPKRNRPSFHVLLRNISKNPQTLVGSTCSATGFPNKLFFKITIDGKELKIVENDPFECFGTFPVFWTIYPKEYFVFDIYFNNEEWTSDLPDLRMLASKTAKIKAIFRSSGDIYTFPADSIDDKYSKYNIWAGEVESNLEEVRFQ